MILNSPSAGPPGPPPPRARPPPPPRPPRPPPTQRALRLLTRHPLHLEPVECLSHPPEIHQRLGDLRRSLDRARRALQRERVAAQRDAYTEPLRELHQVAVVHARERE